MSDHLQRVDEQAKRADEHYKKLCKLEQLLRKRIKALEGGVGGRNWRAQEDACEIIRNVLKEAGLE